MSEESLDTSIKIATAIAAAECVIDRIIAALERQLGMPVVGLSLDTTDVTEMQDAGRSYMRRTRIDVAAWGETDQVEGES